MKSVNKKQAGFTLIELVVVIVILGILAVTALPKFVDLSDDARKAATQGVAGALASASSVNYAAAIARGQKGTLSDLSAVSGVVDTSAGCTTTVATNLLQAGATFHATDRGAYNVSAKNAGETLNAVGDAITCTVTNNDDDTVSAEFTLIGAK